MRSRLRAARWPLAAGALLAASALGLYLRFGAPNQPSGSLVAATSGAPSTAGSQAAGSMAAMLTQLEQRLSKQAGSDADWVLLAQTYDFLGRKADANSARTQHLIAANPAAMLEPTASAGAAATVTDATAAAAPTRASANASVQQLMTSAESARRARDYGAAAAAYQRLAAVGGMSAQTWADYADVAASLNNDKLLGAPERFIDASLALDPNNQKALWLRASAQHEGQRYAEAIASWQRLQQLTPASSDDARIFAANLAEDQALAARSALSGTNASANAASATAAAAESARVAAPAAISGEVALSDALRGKVPAALTLFIVAKSLDSPGPPLAVVRTQTGQWPVRFVLDDSLAMVPGRTLSSAGRVSVEARVSLGGTAAAHSGDLHSNATTIDAHSRAAVRLVIDQIIG
jgi:cytochrome c-type biogenesis protein CcmH